MLFKYTISIVVFVVVNTSCYAQCGDTYTHAPTKYNEPDFDASDITSVITKPSGGYILRIDTFLSRGYKSPFYFHNNYRLFADSTHIQKEKYHWYIHDYAKDTIYSIGQYYALYGEDVIDYNNFLYCHSNANFIFDFTSNKLYTENLDATVLGNDDTSLFLSLGYNQKWKGRKYYYTSIFELSCSGIKMISPVLNKHQVTDNTIAFYTTNWKVTDTLMYEEEKDCSIIDHYKMNVFYNGKLIDTLHNTSYIIGRSYDYFYCNNDTLTWNDFPRKITFFKGRLIDTLNYNDYTKQLPFFGDQDEYDFNRIGNYIFFRLELGRYEAAAVISKDNKLYTLNGMPWRDDNDAYQIMALFNFRDKTFLGYPTLSYISH